MFAHVNKTNIISVSAQRNETATKMRRLRVMRRPRRKITNMAADLDVSIADAENDIDWQTTRPDIAERIKYIFNNELLSDVKFVVSLFFIGNCIMREVAAHKLVLAISSPVFYSIFYGEVEESTDTIKLPDCTKDSLLEFLRYIYTNEAVLTGGNVVQVLYLAKKYKVPSLADKCTEFLKNDLNADNVLCILRDARRFEDKVLEERCWKMIKVQAAKVVTSSEFARSTDLLWNQL